MSKFHVLGQIVVGSVLIDAFVYLALWLWDRRKSSQPKNTQAQRERTDPSRIRNTDAIYHHTLFFPESKVPCRFYYERANGCQRKNCCYSHEAALLGHLISYLDGAKSTVDICVYLITCSELCAAVLNVKNRGVRVRVITEGKLSDEPNSKIGKLRAEGIAVRCNRHTFLMHHKFVVLDCSVLICGSFNWTWQAITGNHENVCITNNPAMVEPYLEEFKTLWNKFDPEPNLSATQ